MYAIQLLVTRTNGDRLRPQFPRAMFGALPDRVGERLAELGLADRLGGRRLFTWRDTLQSRVATIIRWSRIGAPRYRSRMDLELRPIRPAKPTDAQDMTDVQNAIYRAGLRASPVDIAQVRDRYLDEDHAVACTVAVQNGRVVGFQSLKRAWPGNPYDVTEGWGIIGTHIHPDAGRTGLGRRLFARSLAAARAAGLQHIDATIGSDNEPALAYYAAMGFRPYRRGDGAIPHRFDVP